MKILVAMHVFNNFGGIINHNEQLVAGLKELGHEVTFAYLKPTAKKCGDVDTTVCPEGYEFGAGTGLPVHQGKGWLAPYYAFKNADDIQRFVKTANEHDIVIWQSIFGFKNSDTELFTDWTPMIEDVNAKQIVVIHDGNLKKLYSWIYKFSHKFAGLACVHPSAYKQSEFMPVPRNMILNPQDVYNRPTAIKFEDQKRQILSLQTFKRWKRVDDLVAAVPYIENCKVIVAGDGIERNYMTSKDKCKEEYYCTRDRDPDAYEDRLGKTIWNNATERGMEYIGFITEQRRDEILAESMFLIDTSWSNTYGEHFNRVIVDAMRIGIVPIARNFGVSGREDGVGTLFKPGVNYFMIPHDATPKQFGLMVNQFMMVDKYEYDQMRKENYKLLAMFDRRAIASNFVNLALGYSDQERFPTGVHPASITGSLAIDPKAQQNGDKIWEEHFEPQQVSTLDSFFC